MSNITPTLTPRYTDYKSETEVLEAFASGADFTFNDVSSRWHGMACNKDDLGDLDSVKFRYAKLTKVFVIHV